MLYAWSTWSGIPDREVLMPRNHMVSAASNRMGRSSGKYVTPKEFSKSFKSLIAWHLAAAHLARAAAPPHFGHILLPSMSQA